MTVTVTNLRVRFGTICYSIMRLFRLTGFVVTVVAAASASALRPECSSSVVPGLRQSASAVSINSDHGEAESVYEKSIIHRLNHAKAAAGAGAAADEDQAESVYDRSVITRLNDSADSNSAKAEDPHDLSAADAAVRDRLALIL